MSRRNDHWIWRTWVKTNLTSFLTTAVFVVTLGFAVGTFMSVGPANTIRRLTQNFENTVGFVKQR